MDHLNIIVGAHLNWLANIKLKNPGLPGSILLLGAHLNIIVGAHSNWLANIKLKGPRISESILL